MAKMMMAIVALLFGVAIAAIDPVAAPVALMLAAVAGGSAFGREQTCVLPVTELLNGQRKFELPPFQRRYRWEIQQCADLLADIKQAQIDHADLGDYSLGEIILFEKIRDGRVTLSLINGQQRLITITIILGVLRDLTNGVLPSQIQAHISAPGLGNDAPVNSHLSLYDAGDDKVLLDHIQKEGSTTEKWPDDDHLSDVQRRIKDNAKFFMDELRAMTQDELEGFAVFLLGQCTFRVSVSANFKSARRIYEGENARGIPTLSNADMIKPGVLNHMSEADAEIYAAKWNGMDDEIGNAPFGILLSANYIMDAGKVPPPESCPCLHKGSAGWRQSICAVDG